MCNGTYSCRSHASHAGGTGRATSLPVEAGAVKKKEQGSAMRRQERDYSCVCVCVCTSRETTILSPSGTPCVLLKSVCCCPPSTGETQMMCNPSAFLFQCHIGLYSTFLEYWFANMIVNNVSGELWWSKNVLEISDWPFATEYAMPHPPTIFLTTWTWYLYI